MGDRANAVRVGITGFVAFTLLLAGVASLLAVIYLPSYRPPRARDTERGLTRPNHVRGNS